MCFARFYIANVAFGVERVLVESLFLSRGEIGTRPAPAFVLAN